MEVKVLPRTVSKYDYMFKILFLVSAFNLKCLLVFLIIAKGESGVGKSALAGKAADDFFEPNFISTIGFLTTFDSQIIFIRSGL